MLKFLFCLFLFSALFVAAWPLALLMLLAAPFVLLACLGLKALGLVVGGILQLAVWVLSVFLAIALAIVCFPLALIL